jgi:phosphatidate phosphatase APP1
MNLVRAISRSLITGLSFVCPGKIRPVEVAIPSLTDDDDEVSYAPGAGLDMTMDIDDTLEESSVRKGKRKAVD